MIVNPNVISSKIELLIKINKKDGFIGTEKLTFENSFVQLSSQFLIIGKCEENGQEGQIFNLNDIKSYKITY